MNKSKTTNNLCLKAQTWIPPLPHADTEEPDVAQDILHLHALRAHETGIELTPGAPERRYQYTQEFNLAAMTYTRERNGSDDEGGDYPLGR